MATFDYARSRATADRLIQRFGQDATIRRPGEPTGPAYDPTPGVPSSHPCRCAVMNYDQEEIDGTLIHASDLRVYVSAVGLAIEPASTDTIIIGGKPFQIVPPVRKLSPAGTVVYFEIQARA